MRHMTKATFWKHNLPHLALSSLCSESLPCMEGMAIRDLRLSSSAPSSERGALLPLAQFGVNLGPSYSRKRLNNVIGLFGVRDLPMTVAYRMRSERTWACFPGSSDGKKSPYDAGDPGLIPGLGRSPGEGNGYPLQYSYLENPTDTGAWQAAVLGVTKSQTRLKDQHLDFSSMGPEAGWNKPQNQQRGGMLS